MSNSSENLHEKHQAVLYEILQEFDEVCRKHNISYMLFAGSALGAVRHGGFIPWDDDLDVVMLRPEYERFLAVAAQELDREKYYVQKEFLDHWPMFFSKLRKNNTACLERYIPRDPQMHQGVYLDIFPCDNLADGKFMRKLQFYCSKVVIAKSLDRRGYLTDSLKKKLFMAFCRLLPRKLFWRLAVRRDDNDSACVHTFFGGASKYDRNVYPRKWFTETVRVPFRDGQFPVSAHYDEMLTAIYGDYMTPPPESERGCKVHAELVDLENSYTNYREWQLNATFSEYTRSIR